MLPTVWESLRAEGCNSLGDMKHEPKDMQCPEMGGYWKKYCRMRQQPGGGCHRTKCTVGLELTGRTLQAPKREEPAPPRLPPQCTPTAYCSCGEPAAKPSYLKTVKIDEPLCRSCVSAVIEARRERRRRIQEAAREELKDFERHFKASMKAEKR